jgi:hypothetical protein
VNGSFKRCLDLRGRAGEGDPVAGARGLIDVEALAGEPGGELRNVGRARRELVGELFRGEPLVIAGGRRVLLIGEQGFEGGLLRGRAREMQGHARERKAGVDGSTVVFGKREGVKMAAEDCARGGGVRKRLCRERDGGEQSLHNYRLNHAGAHKGRLSHRARAGMVCSV